MLISFVDLISLSSIYLLKVLVIRYIVSIFRLSQVFS